MNLTNRFSLPSALVRAVENDPYDRGDCDFTVTGLLKPPQIARLTKEHPEIAEDVSDRIWSLLGQSVDMVLERAAKGSLAIFQHRYFASFGKYVVSGQIDHFEDGVLTDYKVTSVYAREGKTEWEQQLNLLRLLMVENGCEVEKLQNVLIFRDWRPREAQQKEDYPQAQVLALPIELWPLEKTRSFLSEKIYDHTAKVARNCTDEERWAQPEKWALMKKGGKKAIKLFEVKPELNLAADQFIEHRPGAFRRCEDYCGVSSVCPQWNPPKQAA